MVSRLTAEYGRSGSVVQTLEGTGGTAVRERHSSKEVKSKKSFIFDF
jgi:hypothetical protein